MRRLELTGQKFWYLTVLEDVGTSKNGQSQWRCVCDCWNEIVVKGWNLRSGRVKSCGCKTLDFILKSSTTHGMAKTPLWIVWRGMRDRCYNENCASYKNYGGRGIKVCDRWQDFQNFYDDMSPTYKPGLTIEREDVNGDYDPWNCSWIERKHQSRNRTNTIWVETEFGKMTITEAAQKAGVSWFCMYNRYLKNCSKETILLPAHKVGRKLNG